MQSPAGVRERKHGAICAQEHLDGLVRRHKRQVRRRRVTIDDPKHLVLVFVEKPRAREEPDVACLQRADDRLVEEVVRRRDDDRWVETAKLPACLDLVIHKATEDEDEGDE